MEDPNFTALKGPNYLKMAQDFLNQDCGTWYTQEAQFAFAKYLEENKEENPSMDDLLKWKQLIKI